MGRLSTASAFAGLAGELVCGELMFRRGALWLTRMIRVAPELGRSRSTKSALS